MNAEIDRVVGEINRRIRAMEILRDFLKQFDGENPTVLVDALAMAQEFLKQGSISPPPPNSSPDITAELNREPMASRPVVNEPQTRKRQVMEFLRTNGPTPSREIIANTGIPQSTLSWVLSDRSIFVNEGGRWGLTQHDIQ